MHNYFMNNCLNYTGISENVILCFALYYVNISELFYIYIY